MAITLLSGKFIRSGSIPTTALGGGVVSGSAQIIQALPAGTVSSSTQVTANLPGGTISSSAQFRTIADPFTGSFTGSFAGTHTGTFPYTSLTGIPSGIVSSSTASSPSQGTVRVTINNNNTDVDTGLQVADTPTFAGLTLTGNQTVTGSVVISGSALPEVRIIGDAEVTGSFRTLGTISGSLLLPANIVSASAQVTALLPTGTISSSTQFKTITDPFTGSFTGSFAGTHTGTFPYASLTGIPSGIVSSSAQVTTLLPTGTVSSSAQVSYTGLSNIPSGILSSSTQVNAILDADNVVSSSAQVDVRNTTGIATIATTGSNTFTGIQTVSNTTDSTAFNNGAVIVQGGLGVAKNVNISGSLTVTGLLTAVSSSIQYVTSSQYVVGDNRVIVNTTDVTRFAGLSVFDSGSTTATASIYWDSLNHKFLYENISGQPYNSAILIAGPTNTGTLGNEVGLTAGRVPVASGDDHIDSRLASSSIRVDFPSKFTHIEAGLYVTGSVTSSVGFNGSGANLTNIPNGALTNSSLTVTAGSGLTGGGAISLGGTATVNIGAGLGMTVNADDIAINTGSVHFEEGVRKEISSADTTGASGINLRYNNVSGIISGSLVNSAVTVTAGAGLNGGGAVSLGGTTTVSVNSGSMLPYYSSSIFSTVSGDVLISSAGVASIQANAVTLGTDTSGDYVANITAGNGISSTGAATGETVSHTISVNTGSTHFIQGARGTISVSDTAGASGIDLTYNSGTGVLSGTLVNSTISGIGLGSNLADLTAGTGITYNSGTTYNGGAARTISIGQAVGTTSNVTFAEVTASSLAANQAIFTNASDGLVSNAITGTGNVVMSASPTLTGTISAASATLTGVLTVSNGSTTSNGIKFGADPGGGSGDLAQINYYASTGETTVLHLQVDNDADDTIKLDATGGTDNIGAFRATGEVTAFYSDERLKNFSGVIDNALNKVMSLNGYYYTENELAKSFGFKNDKQQVGVSAQQVQAVLPEAIRIAPFVKEKQTEVEYLTVQYEKLVPLLIQAIKELKTELDELKKSNGTN